MLHLFFFFFFEFRPKSGRFGRYRPIRPIPADMDRVGPIWAASAPISAASAPILAASARFGTRHVARCGTTRHGCAVCGVPPASPRRTQVHSLGSCVRASQLLAHTMLLGFSIYRVNIYKCSQLPFNLDDSLGFKPTS